MPFPFLGSRPIGGAGQNLETWDAQCRVTLVDAGAVAYDGLLKNVPAPGTAPWSLTAWYSRPGNVRAYWDTLLGTKPTLVMGAANGLPAVRFTGHAPLRTGLNLDLTGAPGSCLGALLRYDNQSAETCAAGVDTALGTFVIGRKLTSLLARYRVLGLDDQRAALPASTWTWQAARLSDISGATPPATAGGGSTFVETELAAVWDSAPLVQGVQTAELWLGGRNASSRADLQGDVLAFVACTAGPTRAVIDAAQAALGAEYLSTVVARPWRYKPPAYTSLQVATLAAGTNFLTYTATQDALLVLPAGGWTGQAIVTGGKNLYVIGGIVDPDSNLSAASGALNLRGLKQAAIYWTPSDTAVAPKAFIWGLRFDNTKVDGLVCISIGSPGTSTDPVTVYVGNCWVKRLPGFALPNTRGCFLSFAIGGVKAAFLWALQLEQLLDRGFNFKPGGAFNNAPPSGVGLVSLFDVSMAYLSADAALLGGVLPRVDPSGALISQDDALIATKGYYPVVLTDPLTDGLGCWLQPGDAADAMLDYVNPATGVWTPTLDPVGNLVWPATLGFGMSAPIVAGTLRRGLAQCVDETQDFDALRCTTSGQLDALIGAVTVVANPDTFTVNQDSGPNPVNVLANDTPAGVLTITSVTQPPHGQCSITPDRKTVIYTPTSGYSGADSFSYVCTDGNGTATGSVTGTVTAITQVVANNDNAATLQGVAIDIDVLANDVPAAGLDLSIQTAAGHGTASRKAGPPIVVHYVPNSAFHGSDTFTYKAFLASDQTNFAIATVNLTVSQAGTNRSGLAWKSGACWPANDSTMINDFHHFETFRGRKVDIVNLKSQGSGTFTQFTASITGATKRAVYQTLIGEDPANQVVISQVIDLGGQSQAPTGINDLIYANTKQAGVFPYDTYFSQMGDALGQYLKDFGYVGKYYIRLGHENNANGYWWGPQGDTDQTNYTNYKTYFNRIAALLKARIALKAPSVQVLIDWNWLRKTQGISPANSMPAGADLIGIDMYSNDTTNDAGGNRYSNQLDTRNDWINNYWHAGTVASPQGPWNWLQFALSKGKKICLAETAISNFGSNRGITPRYSTADYTTGDTANGGGTLPTHGYGDTARWVWGMFGFFKTFAANIEYEIYFNIPDLPAQHEVMQSGAATVSTFNPTGGAEYQTLHKTGVSKYFTGDAWPTS